jgi:GNAT superfamily N-acetyltransferase
VALSNGEFSEVTQTSLAWQVHPDYPQLLDEVIDWFDAQAPDADHLTTVRAIDADATGQLARHGYRQDGDSTMGAGSWVQMNARDLADLAEPVLPAGFRFRTAGQVSPDAAVTAHQDAWYPSTLTRRGFDGFGHTWPYRDDLHILIEAADGTLVASAIIWIDEQNRTAEFEPVGTHRKYRQLGLGRALMFYGMRRAREAGATRMLVGCLGDPAHPAAKRLYYSVGFREISRDLPHVKHAAPAR